MKLSDGTLLPAPLATDLVPVVRSGDTDNYATPISYFNKPNVWNVAAYGIEVNNASAYAANSAAFATIMAEVIANKGGTIYFPEFGRYYGHFDITHVVNGSPNYYWFPLTIQGAIAPVHTIGSVAGAYVKTNDQCTILCSNTTTTTVAAIGTRPSSWRVALKDIEIQNIGGGSGVNLWNVTQASLDEVYINIGAFVGGMSSGHAALSFGLKMPPESNGGVNEIGLLSIGGFESGIWPGEHYNARHLILSNNKVGLVAATSSHGNIITRLQSFGNIHTIEAAVDAGAPAPVAITRLKILQWAIEETNYTTAQVEDPSDMIVGSAEVVHVTGGTGASAIVIGTFGSPGVNFPVNGGANFTITDMGV